MINSSVAKKLVIVDPAFGISRGHHECFFQKIVNSSFTKNYQLHYAVDKAISEEGIKQLETHNIMCNKVFDVNFYESYNSSIFQYDEISFKIRLLAKQFISLFYLYKNDADNIVFLYHTLYWDHALALSLAMQVYENKESYKASSPKHLLFFMFHPGIGQGGETNNKTELFYFKMALRGLTKIKSACLFTSNAEYLVAYNRLTGKSEVNHPSRFYLHPNPFAEYSKFNEIYLERIVKTRKLSQILLYMGEAKVEKGFMRLPERAEQFLQICSKNEKVVVQFTVNPPISISLKSVIDQLVLLAQKDTRLILHNYFWTEKELQQQLNNTSLFVLDYNVTQYKNKTSGALWLAGAWHIPILGCKDCWLAREAKRLGIIYKEISQLTDRSALMKIMNNKLTVPTEYAKEISQPFDQWLMAQMADK